MTVIEAKRITALNTSAVAQLIAQVLTVDYTEQSSSLACRSPRVGVLTDGHTWTFYFMPNSGMDSGGDLYESEEITAANKASIEKILGILTSFVGGEVPTKNLETSPECAFALIPSI